MNYFIQAVANNLNAKCSFRCPYSKEFACFFLDSQNIVSKNRYIVLGHLFLAHKTWILNFFKCWKAGNKFSVIQPIKKEESFPKTYSYFSTLSDPVTTHFFWADTGARSVRREKKRVVTAVPNRKICCDFYAAPKADTHKSHKGFSGQCTLPNR